MTNTGNHVRSKDDEALKAALIRLEDKLNDIICEAETIKTMYGVSFISLDPGGTNRYRKAEILLKCGIETVATALEKKIEIQKNFGHENAKLKHGRCQYTQLPDYDTPRYAKAWEQNPEDKPDG